MAAEILSRLAAVKLSTELRTVGEGAATFEEVAMRLVQRLYAQLQDPETGESCCALVRLFKTHPYRQLPPNLQIAARSLLAGAEPPANSACLTLMASAGDLAVWNSRHTSVGHRAIPLHSEELLARSPMITQLLNQFGVPTATLRDGDQGLLLDPLRGSYGVFHVPDAVGSEHVPAQAAFVLPHGVRSVIGCGSPLTSKELFAMVLFSKTFIDADTAARFSTIALSAKLALLPFLDAGPFAGEPSLSD